MARNLLSHFIFTSALHQSLIYIVPKPSRSMRSVIYRGCDLLVAFVGVDTVCIDQQNDAENAEQVSMMGQTYEQAQKVYIWLGAAENGSDAAFDFIQSHAETLLAQGIPHFKPRLHNPEARIFVRAILVPQVVDCSRNLSCASY